jgi:hypothetical protein
MIVRCARCKSISRLGRLLLLVTVSAATGCVEERIPSTIALRAIRHCEDAAAEFSPDHYLATLSEASVRRMKDERYRVRATLNGHGTPKSFECQLDDANGDMEILGLAVVHH